MSKKKGGKKKPSKISKQVALDNENHIIESENMGDYENNDFYFDPFKEDPELKKKAYKKAIKNYPERSKSGGYYEQSILKYDEKIKKSSLFKGVPNEFISAPSSSSSQNEENIFSTTTYTLEEKEIFEIFDHKIVFYNNVEDMDFYESMKANSLYNNLIHQKNNIVGKERLDGLMTLNMLGWDSLKKSSNGGGVDFFIQNIDDNTKKIFCCYHLSYYGSMLAKICDFEKSEDKSFHYGRALVLTEPGNGKNNGSDINTQSPFDLLIFIVDQAITHWCFIPNHIFLSSQ